MRKRWFNFLPEHVLTSRSFTFIKNIIRLYSPQAQPWTSAEHDYCDIMVTAALIRRAELQIKKDRRQQQQRRQQELRPQEGHF